MLCSFCLCIDAMRNEYAPSGRRNHSFVLAMRLQALR